MNGTSASTSDITNSAKTKVYDVLSRVNQPEDGITVYNMNQNNVAERCTEQIHLKYSPSIQPKVNQDYLDQIVSSSNFTDQARR